MFAKLKRKIQEEAGVVPATETKFGSPSVGPGLASPVPSDSPGSSFFSPSKKDNGSRLDSPSSSIDDISKESSSKEEVMAMLIKRSEQVKKLEITVSDLAAMVKEKNKTIEKVEAALEKQQDAAVQRIQELADKHQADKAKASDGFELALEKKEEETRKSMTQQIEDLHKAKVDVEHKLLRAEGYREKYFKKEEENDEFQGLTSQELAKVKHLLLNTQEDLSIYRTELLEKTQMCEKLQKQRMDQEDEANNLMQQLAQLITTSDEAEDQNKRLSADVTELTAHKDTIDKQLSDMKQQLSQKWTEYINLQKEHQALQRISEQDKLKSTKMMAEKDEQVGQLNERLHMLEERLSVAELSGDDRIEALEAERTSLEQRWLESRDQLAEVKAVRSEKIAKLEEEVEHLNSKMAEDTTLTAILQKEKENLLREIEDSQSKLTASQKDVKKYIELYNEKTATLEKQKQNMVCELVECQQSAVHAQQQLQQRIHQLDKKLDAVERARDKERESAKSKISQLENSHSECLEKEIDAEKSITSLEEKLVQIKVALGDKVKAVDEMKLTCTKKDDKLKDIEEKVRILETECSVEKKRAGQAQQTLDSLQNDYHTCTKDKDALMLRNAQLFQEFEAHKRQALEDQQDLQHEMAQKDSCIAGLEQSLQDIHTDVNQHKDKIQRLQQEQVVAVSEVESDEINKLTQDISSLEHQLAEKTKKIKMQQQHMNDLKKTLQRELKVHPLPNDELVDLPRSFSEQNLPSMTHNSDQGHNSHALYPPTGYGHQRTSSGGSISTTSGGYSTSSQGVAVLAVNGPSACEPHSDMQGAGGRGFGFLQNGSNHYPTFTEQDLTDFSAHVNFEYLRHVVLKFMLSREAEAVHLIKAVSVLLKFTTNEQRLLRDTLEWKTSWFGNKPKLDKGQYAKVIHPTF